jgi:Gpi18-like mannosyltransferase
VTAPQADGADRIHGVPRTPLGLSTAVPGLAILLLVGLLIRLTLAYVVLPNSGFESDIGTFTAWALNLAEHGPGSFYATAGFADYPPGYLYILWLIGGLGHLLAPLANTSAASATTALIKLPPILCDVVVAYILYHLVRSWRSPRSDAHQVALFAAGLYLLNPVTWYDSAIWGQTDAFGALITLVTVAALVRGNSEGAAALAVVAALIKPQFGIVLLPLVGIVLLRRHLLRPGSGPRNPVLLPRQLRAWFETEHGPWRLLSSAVAAMAVLIVFIAPFSLDLFRFVDQMQRTAAGYPYLSVNAYNPWALIGSDGAKGIAFGGAWSWNPDTVPLLGPLPGVVIGGALLALGFALGVARAGWRDDRRSIIVVAIFLALAFFMLPTRVHERYMFPVFALLPLLAAVDRRWMWVTIALSVAAFINLHGVLTTELYATPNLEHLPFGELFRQTPGVLTSIALNIGAFLFIAWQLRPAAAEERDPYIVGGYEAPEQPEPIGDLGADGAAPSPGRAGAVGVAAVASADLDLDERPAAAAIGSVSRWLRDFVGFKSIRRDRSALLAGESGGRFDRWDLLFVLLVFASTLALRTYRLEVPYGMHFDEVYHARTATEFLQDWRYGIPHSIYEYTHPHLAKYAMAMGIEALGQNQVIDTRELGGTVRAAAVERRWSPPSDVNAVNGDRFYVLTDSEVRAYDLATKAQVATIPGTYDAIAVDQGAHVVYLATAGGALASFDTTPLDNFTPASPGQVEAQQITQLNGVSGQLTRLAVAGELLVALSDGGTVVGVDLASHQETGRTIYPDPVAVVGISGRSLVMVDPAEVTDAQSLAQTLAGLIDRDPFALQTAIESATEPVPVAGYISKSAVTEVTKKIDDGELEGVSIGDGPALAIGLSTGVVLIDADSFNELAFIGTFDPVTGMALAERGVDRPTIYAAAGNDVVTVQLPSDDAARLVDTIEMPNTVQDVYWNEATTKIHVLGLAQDGSGPTVYVIEPHANAVFADARLSGQPQAVVVDVQRDRPAEDRDDLLAIGGAGHLDVVDVGNNQFAYRFPGVVLGALMAVCIYLLGRFLFNRRIVALIVALFVLVDGMMFANARIAMNDIYVGFFIVAAFTLFVPIWLGRWRNPLVVAAAVLGVGLLLGLALASKWVGAYAIGGLGLLILLRSALGRILAVLVMVALTAVLGYLAITPNPSVENPQLNFPFLALMLGLTVALAVGITLRPLRMTIEELRLAVIAPIVAGAGIAAFGLYRLAAPVPATTGQLLTPTRILAVGLTLIALGVVALVVGYMAGRYGHGPLARSIEPVANGEPASSPAPRGWLRPGSGFLGLPWLLALGAITLVPLAVYVISYVPWINLGNHWGLPFFPPGTEGQAFLDLQKQMYEYHNYLRATHPASSPWWAWPLDLKPVWFEQSGYAGDTTAVIYDTGNLVLFWLGIPAAAWVAYMAWKRRSLALGFVTIAIASMWLPWARIDRATFQYHYFTTLPFLFMALAYFVAELWHGPSQRTWALARVAAAICVIGAPLLWLLRLPLCAIARTEQVNPGTEVCATLTRQLTLTDWQLIGVIVAVLGLFAAGAVLVRRYSGPVSESSWWPLLMPVFFSMALLGAAIVVIGAGLRGRVVFEVPVQAELPSLGAFFLLLIPAYFVLRATDPKRFVVATLGAAVVWFIAFYPNIGSLPVPSALAQIHLGLLPTWNWGFQFAVNMDEPNRAPLDMASVGILALATLLLCLAAIYAVRSWRGARAAPDSSISPLPEAG